MSKNPTQEFNRLLVSALSAGMFISSGALAQTNGSALALEEVTVTAEKRTSTVQDTPLALTALSGESMENRGIVSVQDFNAIAPNVSFGELNGFARINIRGIGNQNFFTGGDPSVSMYVDGAVIARAAAQMSAFFDLDRVEVLRGPQGTLYGRNATGGSVNVITRKPTEEFEGYVKLGLGNYDHFQVESALSGPISDDGGIKGRVAFLRQTRSGTGINEFNGQDVNDVNRFYSRAHLEFDGDDHHLLLSLQHGREDDTNYQVKVFKQANPGDAGRPTGVILGGSQANKLRNVNSETDLRNTRETFSLTANYDWTINDALTFTSITNYRDYQQDYMIDIDATEVAYADVQQLIDSEQISQELQLNYEGDNFNLVTGFFYYEEEIGGDNNLGPYQPSPVGLPGDFYVALIGEVDIEATGVFSQINYQFSDSLSGTFGIRYSDEERKGTGISYGPTTAFPAVPTPREIQDDDVSYRVGLDWSPSEDVLLYVNYSEGFKSGVVLVGSPDPAAKPELVESYEIGIKADLMDNRVRANVAAFTYDYQDLQITQLLQGGSVPSVTNAANADISGVEIELSAVLTERLLMDLKMSYLDATFEDYVSRNPRVAPPAQSPELDLSGNTLPYSPEYSGNLHIGYRLPVGEWEKYVDVHLNADITYTDDVTFSVFNEADLSQKAHAKVDASVLVESVSGDWSLNFWAKNLTDKTTFSNLTVGGGLSTNRNIYGVLSAPRMVGVTGSIHF